MDAYNTCVRPNLECAQVFVWSSHTSPHVATYSYIINNINELEAQPATASSLYM